MFIVNESPRGKVKEFWGNTEDEYLQADLRDIVGLVPDHLNKANTAINQVM